MSKDKAPDPQAIFKSFLKWMADGQPLITKCGTSHASLHDFCKSRQVATTKSIATELLKLF